MERPLGQGKPDILGQLLLGLGVIRGSVRDQPCRRRTHETADVDPASGAESFSSSGSSCPSTSGATPSRWRSSGIPYSSDSVRRLRVQLRSGRFVPATGQHLAVHRGVRGVPGHPSPSCPIWPLESWPRCSWGAGCPMGFRRAPRCCWGGTDSDRFRVLAACASWGSFLTFVPAPHLDQGRHGHNPSLPFGSLIISTAPSAYYGPVTSSRTTIGQFAYALGIAAATVSIDKLTLAAPSTRLREAGVPPSQVGTGLDAVTGYGSTGESPTTDLGRQALSAANNSYHVAFHITMVAAGCCAYSSGSSVLAPAQSRRSWAACRVRGGPTGPLWSNR